MIAVDTNVLVYAHREDSPWHEAAFEELAALAECGDSWAIPWPCLHEFISVVTHPHIYKPPTPLKRALDQVDAWLECPSLVLLSESDTYWPALRSAALAGKIAGAVVYDARIAALCTEHGVRELWSADRDLSRFPKLVVRNLLVRE